MIEDLTVSLEVARKLKEAGWGHGAYFSWREHLPNTKLSFVLTTEQVRYEAERYSIRKSEHEQFRAENKFYLAPTASEIVEVLPYITIENHGLGKKAYWNVRTADSETGANAPTMADALALLWIKLQEEK